jgi:hypothetical protein
MLRQTYLHIPGVGAATERKIWEHGLRSWDDFLAGADAQSLRNPRWELFATDVRASVERYASKDWKFFDRNLPSLGKWRAFGDFPGRALYLDIETNGGVTGADITVLGAYDGETVRSFVAGENMDEAQALIEAFPVIVTYNGAQFDMPIVRDRFRYNFFNHIHIDLRFPLNRLGYRGGLKSIETQLGIARSEATRGLGGFDAVRLWAAAEQGSREARELLLAYNAEDVVNLKPLMELVYARMAVAMQGAL